jgi:ActD protein
MASSIFGLIATFENVPSIYHAAEKVRDAGYKKWDCITPLPIHGLDRAMGVRRSIVPRFSLAGGITGFCTGMLMIWWMDGLDYKLIVGGKPLFSPLFAFPVSYELTILFTAFATIGGMFFLNGLPRHYHAVLKHPRIDRAMDDRFFIVIESSDPRFDLTATRALLEEVGGTEILELED